MTSEIFHGIPFESDRQRSNPADIVRLPKKFSKRFIPKVTADMLFAGLVGFPKIVFFDGTRLAKIVGLPKMFEKIWEAEDVLFTELVGFPNIVHVCFDSARLDEIVGFDYRRRSKKKLDFPRGYRRCPICRISRISEDCLLQL